MPLLVCPNCEVGMLVVQREGVELDTCPRCRGVWLDRGELDKLLQPLRNELQHRQDPEHSFRTSTPEPRGDSHRQYDAPPRYRHEHDSKHYDHGKDKHYRKKNPLESLLDIFD
ncbi:MAG: zf-TFIIB domain-containing protein [Magnetococcales bacterium]|nr:zf-TFIIB domain-containing protein [Magnetococcales bacterium]MBF0148455.1 zf-TFIIB domain-containing protein [Magnetococcales bacterium]MBF0172602.1 zf-TFIIB domain-containing protein [Magnetococcales bacterium]MBF0346289.1 zf-TFIIB domain-containing protein [Magnetococcales bacterium]MBF0629948.1 zf-TFIIB domain-containing protein [Magnetococcales bacterium]